MESLLNSLKAIKLWQAGVLVAVLLGAGAGVYAAYELAIDSGGTDLGEDQRLIPVQRDNLTNEVSVNGSIRFPNRETLSFDVQGTVEDVLVQAGDRVEEGQELARLDQATVASLALSEAQTKLALQQAEDALAEAREPYSALDLARAEADVANARLAHQKARDALADLLAFTAQDVTRAEAKVANAGLAVEDAQNALDEAGSGPGSEDLAGARSMIDSATTSLENAGRDLSLTESEWTAKLDAARDDIDSTVDVYRDIFEKWLGIERKAVDGDTPPDELLTSMGVDLDSLFADGSTLLDSRSGFPDIPTDDPGTPWNEFVVFALSYLDPEPVYASCEDDEAAAGSSCIRNELDDAWSGIQSEVDVLDTLETQAAKAVSTAEAGVTRAGETLADAEQALADLMAGPDPLEVQSKETKLSLARTDLQDAEEELAELTGVPDALEVEAKEGEIAVALATLDEAETALSDMKNSEDSLEVSLGEAQLVRARLDAQEAADHLASATITAPIAGIVSVVDVEAGQDIDPRVVVFEIVDPTVVEVDGIVDEIDVLFVRLGAQAGVTMDALPGAVLEGAVSAIDSVAQNQQGVVSFPISIRVQLPTGVDLVEGLSATASIVLREDTNVLLVPEQAIFGTFDQPLVSVMNGGALEDRPVTLGNSDGFWTVVVAGLQDGDQVAIQITEASDDPFAQIRQRVQAGGFGGGGTFGGGGGRGGFGGGGGR